jgi:MOSC domain-containing protein YiiM
VSQPRGPCYKFAARWGHKELPDRMAQAGISGCYFRVLRPGRVESGDEIQLVERVLDITITEVMRVTYTDRRDREALVAVASAPELAAGWRAAIERSLDRLP